MRLIIRVKNQASKLEHIAEKQINQGLSSRTQINPLEQADDAKFQLSYLVTHNTKVIRTTFTPINNQMDELIAHISKSINLSDQYLILRIFNKYPDVSKQSEFTQKSKQAKGNKEPQKVIETNTYKGIQFSQKTIKKVKLVKGFSLGFYNINIENKAQGTKQTSKDSVNGQNMKTLQVQAQILPAYYRSIQYKKIITQNRNSQMNQINARLTFIHGNIEDKYGVNNVIREQQQDEDEDQINKKFQNIKFVDLEDFRNSDNNQRKPIYDPSISSFRGEILRIRKPPLKDHKHFYEIDPYEGFFKEFQTKDKYPKSAQQIFSLNFLNLKDIEKVAPKDISWYMKKDLHYFTIEFNNKGKKQRYKFACNFQDTIDKWIDALKNSLEKWEMIRRQRSILLDLVRNHKVILDMRDISGSSKSPKKLHNKYIQAFQNTFNNIQTKLDEDQEYSPTPKKNVKSQESNLNKDIFSLKSQKSESTDMKKSQTKTSATTVPEGQQNSKKQTKKEKEKQKQKHQEQVDKIMIDKELDDDKLQLRHFRFIKELGEGSFGQVFLARCSKNNHMYALKVFKKKKLVMNKQIKFAISQINILKQINHPFVISLHFTFQTPNYIYLGLDYCSGKDLSHHLIEEVNFSEIECQFYAAELILALEYLHSLDIIYRDLKPENILLDEQGHLKIIDFGLSKQAENNIAKSFCGSPAYISPEMLKKNGVGKECDFFSLGAVVYEMLVGEPPFYSEDIKQLYDNIANAKLKFPKIVSERGRSLLQGLLRKNPKQRLGSKGIDQIKNHEFFKGVDWNKMVRKQCVAPKRIDAPVSRLKEDIEGYDEAELLKIIHDDFDYTEANIKINRFKNFSFVREGEF